MTTDTIDQTITTTAATTNGDDNMLVTPFAAFSAHSFSGSILLASSMPATTAAPAPQKAANHSHPSILQQIAIYRRLQKARSS